ncbi:MAG: Zn-ribbon domain-containing OB-fold protein [Burkholderiales bacterium]|nr:Zn-ribbon domain-containing OB-fold protein [Burkholderiales bacterium]
MATPYRERTITDPQMNTGDEPYFEAAAQGRLVLKQCGDCGEYHHYPRSFCPFCQSENVSWRDAKGTGTVYSYSIMRRGTPVPFCIAYVTLAEGVTMVTNIVDCDLDSVRVGQPVKVTFKKSEGGISMPMFTPI